MSVDIFEKSEKEKIASFRTTRNKLFHGDIEVATKVIFNEDERRVLALLAIDATNSIVNAFNRKLYRKTYVYAEMILKDK